MPSDADLMNAQFQQDARQVVQVVQHELETIVYEELVIAVADRLKRAFKAGERRATASIKK